MGEAERLLTISELVRRAQPFTATSSLNSSPTLLAVSDQKPQSQPSPPGLTSNSNPIPKILSPLSQSVILIGTLLLPTETLSCPNKNCFQFSDGSSTICCDILDFSVRAVGKKIHVLAWNFIPLKHSGGGFLEIIRWNFPDSSTSVLSRCSNVDSISIVSGSPSPPTPIADNPKARYLVHGPIESISPVSLVPCSIGASETNNIRGFIVQIMVCECKLCNSKESITILHNLAQGQHPHSFIKPLFIYFFGSSCFWHPVITKLIGNVVTLSGLKKKLIFIGKEDSQLMFVIAENSVLHLPRLSKKWSPFLKIGNVGKGECGAYTGVVRGVYMQGMAIELDKEVWLLITDQLLTAPHSLRVGAIISLRNVHFVNPKFTWTQMLILGTCSKTSITVESFSPLETGCNVVYQSQSQLGKFIDSLNFSARLWALLVVSSFRKKFAGILSEKAILGSKHKEGLAQMFCSSHLPPSVIRAQQGIIVELCRHKSCGCDSEAYCANLKLVAPISTFLHHCETMWMRAMKRKFHILHDDSQFNRASSEGRSRSMALRRMFQSRDIGFSLLGSLKISPSSGRLQLVDATGSIDVIIPDLPSNWKSNGFYEIVDYNLIMEGTPDFVDYPGLPDSESCSCRHIFCYTPFAREMNLTVYLNFHLSNQSCNNLPFYPCVDWNNEFIELQGGRFHLICITHKYPVLQKFKGEPVIADCCTVFAEAIILPWDLFLSVKDGAMLSVKNSGDWHDEPSAHCPCENYQDHLCNKKRKNDHVSTQAFKGSSEGEFGNLYFLEIPCLATVRTANRKYLVGSGRLCFTKSKIKIGAGCKLSEQKVLLEFNSENFFKYQVLQIGRYYIVRHHPEESFCIAKDCHNVSCDKKIISSRTHIWGLSFSFDEVVTSHRTSNPPSQNDYSISCEEVPLGDKVELLLSSIGNFPGSSDVVLHLSANAKGFLDRKLNEAKESLTEPHMTPEETLNDSPNISTMLSSSNFSSGSLDFTWLFPEGNLTSVCGDVVDIRGFDCNSANFPLSCERLDDDLHVKFFRGSTNVSCIHVLVDNQMVSIFGSLSKHAYLVGFGPGVNATFHRILKSRVANKLKLTPVSFITLNSVRVANEPYSEKSSKICSTLCMSSAASLDNVSSGTISELIQCSDYNPMRFNCRVVAVQVLVLEKNIEYYGLPSKVQAMPHCVDIPLVGFVLDDGSSTCCCWANGQRAATLLRLHEELPLRASESSGCTLRWLGIDKSVWKSTMFHLERILRKHSRIIVRNHGSIIDSSYQDLTVSVSSDNALSTSDENLLKLLVFNSCFSRFWTVIAGVMDPNAIKQLEKEHLIEMEMAMLPMQNVWAMEVQYTDTLIEARNMIEELISR